MAFSIKEEHVQRAFNTLHENKHAAARAAYEFAERQLKVVLAKAAAQSDAKTVAQAERDALMSHEYERALSDFKLVAEAYYEAKDRREAAVAVIDGWRTQQSDQRALGRVG